jgi:Carboxypeptidase regulatory-like domain/TonB dependent receptor
VIKFSPVVALVLGLHFCMGQGISTHTITGVLQDQTGAVIVGAEVVLLAPDGSNVGTTSTNKAGEFEFRAQGAGSYSLRAHQEGFKDGTTTIKVVEAAVINVRMVLAVSTLDEQVSVESQDAAPQVATEAAQNQDVNEVDRGELDRLPVFDQNYIATLSRFLDSDQTGTNGVSLIVNGVEANGPGMTSSAIKNVKINQNPYSALYAKPGRARVEIETAEGTPQFHGTINFLLRNSVFDARNAFALSKPSEQRNYLEGSLTGPLGHGKKNTFVLSLQQDYDNKEAIVAAVDATGPVNVNVPNPDHHFFGSGRVFHTPREGEQVYLSYSYERETIKNQGVGGTVLPEAGTNYLSFEHEINVGYNRVLSAQLLNQLHFLVGYNENPVNSISNTPGIDVSGEFRGGGAQLTLRRTEGHFDGTDVMTYVRGKHEMKFGVDIPDISRRGFEDLRNAQGVYSFASLADYQSGHPYSYLLQTGDAHVTFLEKVVSGFFEDNYRLSPNFAIIAGVRYYWQNYFHDVPHDIAPRFGFAYSPGEKRKTVIRGGVGMFYDRTGPRPISDLLHFDGNHLVRLIADYTTQPFSYPITPAEVAALPPGLEILDPRQKMPLTLQYSFGIERQITPKSTLAANYIGSQSSNVFRSIDANAPVAPSLNRPTPNFGQIREVQSEGYQKNNSFELAFRGKPTKYFSGQARYALAKTYNNTAGVTYFPAYSYAPQNDWSRSDNDRRHKFDLLGTFEAENRFTFGVALAAYSGKPVNVTTGNDENGDGYALDRPPGIPRNSMHGPGYLQLDLNLGHEFKLGRGKKENKRLALTLNSFNVLNHRNDLTYIGVISSSFFGQARQANPPRQMQLNMEFKF